MRSTAARPALPAAVAIVALLVVAAAAPAPAAAQQADDRSTTFDFGLQTDGDARVTVTIQLELDDEPDQEAFDRLADRHTSGGESPLSAAPFERAAERASESAGRQMDIRDVTRSASRTNDTGQLVLSFTWANFTESSGERILVGDVFRTPSGTWFPGLAEDQTLVVTPPEGYTAQSIAMAGERYQLVNGTVRVDGPATFEPGTPSLVLRQTTSIQEAPPWGMAAAVAAALLLLAVLAFVFRDRALPIGHSGEATDDAEPEPDGPEEADPMAEPLLSDEERVLRLLEARDGRMKQVEIVEATDWSNAKVSQLLSEMEEDDRIDKLRIGRENLISLPGQGPGSE